MRFEFLAAPVRFLATGRTRARVELVRMELGPPDESGRRRPQPVPGSEFTLEADTVVLAIGYSADGTSGVAAGVVDDRLGCRRDRPLNWRDGPAGRLRGRRQRQRRGPRRHGASATRGSPPRRCMAYLDGLRRAGRSSGFGVAPPSAPEPIG